MLAACCVVVAGALAAALTYAWSERAGLAALSKVAAHQLDLYSAGLESELRRHGHLPSYLELDLDVLALLRSPSDTQHQRKVSEMLGKISVRAGTISIFVLDSRGMVVAASNWQPESLLGTDYSGRSLFGDALRGGLVGFFSGVAESPEYYLAEAIRENGRLLGVAVVKIGLDALESNWAASASNFKSNQFLVVDENEVVILSSEAAWKYKATAALDGNRREELLRTGKYPNRPGVLEPVGIDLQRVRSERFSVLRVRDVAGGAGLLPFVASEKRMLGPAWRFIALSEASGVGANARNTAVAAGCLAALLGLTGFFLIQRHRTAQEQLRSAQALQEAQYEMGLKVEEHNAELRRANAQLRREVQERLRAEAELREAQDGLVQAGKLALLGQLSTGIAHEINQPLTALRALSDNTRRLLEMGRMNDVQANLTSIAGLTERMGRLTRQLKTFARKAPAAPGQVQLAKAVANALLLVDGRIRQERVDVVLEVAEQLRAACDGNRLEQVLVNLIANALDAMKGLGGPARLEISARMAKGRVVVRVADSGPGIPDAAMKRLFEPFFSTKPAGEGLGLGLVISAQLVREFGSDLRAFHSEGGAAFEFDLQPALELSRV